MQASLTVNPKAPSPTPPPDEPTIFTPQILEPETLSWAEAVALLDTIPGVGRQTAELMLAEVGTDMSRFPSAAHLAKWTRLCLGNYESAGKRYSGRTELCFTLPDPHSFNAQS